MEGLPKRPKLVAPDVSTAGSVAEYVRDLDLTRVDAIGHHLYGIIPTLPDDTQLSALNQLGNNAGLPLFQTEMPADGYGSAILLHHTLVTEGTAAYLHSALVVPLITPNVEPTALIAIGSKDFELEPAYYALRHYAAHTDPGWVRVSADASQANLLASRLAFPNQQRTNDRARKHKYGLR